MRLVNATVSSQTSDTCREQPMSLVMGPSLGSPLMGLDLDPLGDWVPVVPTAHFSMRNRFSVPIRRCACAKHSSVGRPYEGLHPIARRPQILPDGEALTQRAGINRCRFYKNYRLAR